MSKQKLIESLYIDKKLAEDINFNPYYQLVQSGLGRRVKVSNKSLISLGTNDYLGIANSSILKREAQKALDKYGLSLCGTPIVIGQSQLNRQLEIETARFLNQDDALIFPSCYQCNMSVFQILAQKEDLIIGDKEIHSSLLNGIGLSKAAFKIFPHNNTDKLERILAQSGNFRMKFIVVEGLYSTNGDIPPLDKIVSAAKKYDAFLIVDDAHGLGVLGKEGRGILEVFDVYDGVDLVTGSFGKAIGTFGGFIAARNKIIDEFRYKTPMYFYSTALPPLIAAATLISLQYTKEHPELREKITIYAKKLYSALKSLKFRLTDSTTPLVSVVFPSSADTFRAAKMLFERGVYGVPFIPPSVPKRSPRIRLTINAALKEEDIDAVIEAFTEIAKAEPRWLI